MPRGGFREGAGRKPLPEDERRVQLCVYLDRDLLDWVNLRADQEGKSASQVAEGILKRSRRSWGSKN